MTDRTPDKITDAIIGQAEQWHTLFAEGEFSFQQREAFTLWYDESPAHQKAYAQVAFAQEQGFDFTNITKPEQKTADIVHLTSTGKDEKPQRSKAYRPWTYGALAAAAVLVATIISPILRPASYMTTTGATQLIALSDSTEVLLGAKSSLRVHAPLFGDKTVYLDEGEALFTISKNSHNPFKVIAAGTEVQVLGTRFNINKANDALRISLLEGKVKVVQSGHSVELAPAETVSIQGGIMQAVEKRDVKNMAAWTDGQLTYKQTPLHQVLSDLQRYTDKHLALQGADIAHLPVTATFSTEQVETVIENLPFILPVKVSKPEPDTYILEKG